MGDAFKSFVGVIVLIIMLAIVAVVVSKKAGTAQLVQSFSTALDTLLSRATSKAT